MEKRDTGRDKYRRQKAKKNNDLFRDEYPYKNKKLFVSLPIPPSINHMYIQRRSGKRSLTSAAKKYILESTALIQAAVEDQYWVVSNDDSWFYLDIEFYMPDRKIRDSHNTLKILLDVFQDCAYRNDYFVLCRIQKVELDADNPRIEVCLKPQTVRDRRKQYV